MNLKTIPGSKVAIPFPTGACRYFREQCPPPRAGVGFLVGVWPWGRSWGGMTGPGAHTGMVPSQREPLGGVSPGNAFYYSWLNGHHLQHEFLCELVHLHTRPQYWVSLATRQLHPGSLVWGSPRRSCPPAGGLPSAQRSVSSSTWFVSQHLRQEFRGCVKSGRHFPYPRPFCGW